MSRLPVRRWFAAIGPYAAWLAAAGAAPAARADAPMPAPIVTGVLAEPHAHGAGVELPDGDVLVCGGRDNGSRGVCERWSSASNLWSPAPPLSSPRHDFVLLRLADGSVAAIGGEDRQPVQTIEVLPPGGGHWSVAGALPIGLAALAAHRSRTGEVSVVGRPYTAPFSRIVVLTGDPGLSRWAEHDVGPALEPWGAAALPPPADESFVVTTEQSAALCHPPPSSATKASGGNLWLIERAGRAASWRATPEPVSAALCAQLAPDSQLAPTPLTEQSPYWGQALTLQLSSGAVLMVLPFSGSIGVTLRPGLGWRLGVLHPANPCDGPAALVESFAAPLSGELDLPAPNALGPLNLFVSADCRRAYAARDSARLAAALGNAPPAPSSPSPRDFPSVGRAVADYLLCTLAAPFDRERLAAVVLHRPRAFESSIATEARSRCLTAMARLGDPAAARVLAAYAADAAFPSESDDPGAGARIDPALLEALPTTPELRATASDVLERALARRAHDTDALRFTLCGPRDGPAAPPVCRRAPASPERQWALAVSRRGALILLGFKLALAVLMMVGGLVWRRSTSGRLVAVLATLIGGAYAGVDLASAANRNAPCKGVMCGFADAIGKTVGGATGAGVGLATGLALSFAGARGIVAGTTLGVVALVGAAVEDALDAWNDPTPPW